MKTLKLIRQCLTVLGLCSKSKNSSYDIFMNWTIVCLLTAFLMITFEYIVTHFDDHANVLYAIMQFVTFVTVWTCYICFAMEKSATFQFNEELQLIADDYGELINSIQSNSLGNYWTLSQIHLTYRKTNGILWFVLGCRKQIACHYEMATNNIFRCILWSHNYLCSGYYNIGYYTRWTSSGDLVYVL